MTHSEEQELLQLTRENNQLLKVIDQLLKVILALVQHDESNDFIHNVLANLISNRIGGNYA